MTTRYVWVYGCNKISIVLSINETYLNLQNNYYYFHITFVYKVANIRMVFV